MVDTSKMPADQEVATSNGGCTEIHSEATALMEPETIVRRARIRFLSVALCNTIAPALVGIVVYHVTNSLTIEVDFASASCDAASLFLNILIEYVKPGFHSKGSVLLLDFAGGFISVALLFAVAIFGVLHATNRVMSPVDPSERVEHIGLMLFYNVFSLMLDIFTLLFWYRSRNLLMPQGWNSPSDQLNVNSGLMHSVVDFMRGLSVTFTSVWMIYINMKGETPWMDLKDKVHGDVFGSFLLCACVLVSAAILLKESIDTLKKICYSYYGIEEKVVEDSMPLKSADEAGGGENYGSLKAAV